MINTVNGIITKESLGITLPHEHILIDMRQLMEKENRSDFYEPITLKNRYKIWSDPYFLLDNAFYNDEDVALKELLIFKAAGGNSIVDATSDDIGRKPEILKRLSEKSGVNIIMGCGHYTDGAHPLWVKEADTKTIAKEIISDITVGVNNTGIKSGLIGEIGTSAVVTENEWKVVEASGIAGAETDYPVHIHTSLWEENGIAVARKLIKMNVKPEKICIDHIDVDIRMDYLNKLLDMGIYIEFDNFGKEFFIPPRKDGWLKGKFAYDYERCETINKLIQKGYCDQILITNDLCLKSMLINYGGNGYAHIINNIMPMLEDAGVSKRHINQLVIQNPAKFLDVKE